MLEVNDLFIIFNINFKFVLLSTYILAMKNLGNDNFKRPRRPNSHTS